MMQISVVGKSNTGKSTFFSAATLVDAEISNRIFTTIEPNKGASYVRVNCACKSLGLQCKPAHGKCVDGQRFVPIKMIDIAGLVPGAHEGRGLGNKFLTDIMEANALIHVVDISGTTDDDGNQCEEHDPAKDIMFLEEEIDYWILGLLEKNWSNIQRRAQGEKIDDLIYEQLSGLMVDKNSIKQLVEKLGIVKDSSKEKLLLFATELRKVNKPMIVAGNKIDVRDDYYQKLKSQVIPCFAEGELALRRAAEKGLVKYLPGDSDFEVAGELTGEQKKAIDKIKNVMDKYGSTGVQETINRAVFELLDYIVVYPVQNENKMTDAKGNVLPDALLLKKGSTARDLAYAVHEDIGKNFITAVDCRTGRQLGAETELKNGDIVSIRSGT
jgi:hypothetical protein